MVAQLPPNSKTSVFDIAEPYSRRQMTLTLCKPTNIFYLLR
ncbi:MAG: hypothetical protein QXQ64_08560 [Candidatus Bathyarchaeia archaeon]